MCRALIPIDTDEGRVLSQARATAGFLRAGEDVEAVLLSVFDDRETAEATSVTRLATGRRVADSLSERGVSVESENRHGDSRRRSSGRPRS